MFPRALSLLAALLAVALFSSGAALAADTTHEGVVVKAGDGKLTMTGKGSDKKHTMDVAKDATITIGGKAAKLEDLKEGMHIKVTMDDKHVVHKIDGHSKGK